MTQSKGKVTRRMHDSPERILGVSETADIDQINAAYRKLARKHHPDMGGDRHQFQLITEAYEELLRKARQGPIRFELPGQSDDLPPGRPRSDLEQAYASPLPSAQRPKPKTKAPTKKSPTSFFTRKLPLQDETAYFILVNALDIFLTYLILKREGIEANPIANWFYRLWNIQGMVAFKMAIVALVCVIAQLVAIKSIRSGQRLLWFGTAAIGLVVVYSIFLLASIPG